MTTIADRVTGLLVAAIGLSLFLFVIPNSVEAVDSGWLLPGTLPSFLSLILTVSGVVLFLKPTDHSIQPFKRFLMCAVYFGLLLVGLWAMSYFGFMIIGPIIALAIMLLIGEHRPFWLVLGVVGMPAIIWVVLVWLLERGLP